jgi:hypothetical protein
MTQAGMISESNIPGAVWTTGMSISTAEKFAELIVQECVAICQEVDGEDNIDARSGRQDCAVEIREHFGVEE